jgi:anti-sigma regulatory factor (Ser/Thr protein kinase)
MSPVMASCCKNHAHFQVSSGPMPCDEGQMPVQFEKTMHCLSREFPARLQAFEQVKTLIDEFGALAALGREDRHKLTIIVEELFTNTVIHGHRGDSDAPVFVTLEEDRGELSLIYEDSAPQFDPFAAGRSGGIDATITDRRIGGLGLHITIALASKADYSYVDGRNRICLGLSATRD